MLALNKRDIVTVVLFSLPALIPLSVFWIGPMFYIFYLSLTDWDFMSPAFDFVGFDNYLFVFEDPAFYRTLWNTLYFTAGSVIPSIAGGLGMALLLNRRLSGIGLYRTIIFSPWVTPTVAVAIVWSWILQPDTGVANWVLSAIGLPRLPWLSSSKWAMPSVLLVTVWKQVGWTMIFYLVALQRIPQSLHDAAKIDGVSAWTKLWYITWPLISPTTLFLVVVMTIDALNAFDQIHVMTQGGPAGATRTLLYMYYQSAFERFNSGEAAVIGVVMLAIAAVLSALQFWSSRRWVHYD